MGQVQIEGLPNPIGIVGDVPTQEELARIRVMTNRMGLTEPARKPDRTVVESLGMFSEPEPFITEDAITGQLKIPLGSDDEGFNLGRAVTKGMRDMIAGGVTFPFDLAGEDAISDAIRRNIPQIETGNTAEDVTAALTQFGVPAAGISKGVTAASRVLGVGPGTGVKTAIARWFTQIGAVSGSDAAVADPDGLQTVGNIFPELLPTGIDPEDTNLGKRMKLGVESGMIAPPVAAVIGAASLIIKGIAKVVRPFVSSDEVATEIAGRSLREIVIDPDNAVDGINRTLRDAQGTEFRPGAGVASGDPGLIAAERARSSRPEFVARERANRIAIGDDMERAIAREGDADAPRKFLTQQAEDEARGIDLQLQATERQAAAARVEIDNIADQLSGYRRIGQGDQITPETQAALDINDAVRSELERLTMRKNELFAKIDPDWTVVIDPKRTLNGRVSSLFDTIVQIGTKKGGLDSAPSRLRKYGGNIYGKLRKRIVPKAPKPGEAPKPLEPLTFGELENIRPEISRAISDAAKANDGEAVKRLTILRDSISRQAEILANDGGQAAIAAGRAVEFFKLTYAPRFRDGVGKTIRDAENVKNPVAPSAVAGRFLKPDSRAGGSLEAARDLERIIKSIPDPTAAQDAVRRFVVSRLSNFAIDGAGKFHPGRVLKFLDQNKTALSAFPGVKQEIEGLARRSTLGGERLTVLEQEIKELRVTARTTERERNKATASLFIGRDPRDAIDRIMRSGDPAAGMREVMSEVGKDATGEATRGLRVSMSQWVDDFIKGADSPMTDRAVLKAHKVQELFNSPRTRAVMEAMYSPAELKSLRRSREQLLILNRINQQVTANSSTASLSQTASRMRIVLASVYGIVRGRGISAISEGILNVFGVNPKQKAEAMLDAMLLDPELAKVALLPATRAGEKVAAGKIKTYLANNLLAGTGDDDGN